MEYGNYIRQVMKLPFINDPEAADSAIKAVLGVLASRIEESDARRLAERLPPELNFWVLRGRQRRALRYTADQFVSVIAQQFHLDWGDAKQLVDRVLHCVKESDQGNEAMEELQSALPPDWAEIVDRA